MVVGYMTHLGFAISGFNPFFHIKHLTLFLFNGLTNNNPPCNYAITITYVSSQSDYKKNICMYRYYTRMTLTKLGTVDKFNCNIEYGLQTNVRIADSPHSPP